MSAQCVFCRDDVQDATFCSSINTRAIYNIAPVLPGHTLVIPKRHVARVAELSDAEFADVFAFGRRIAQLLEEVFSADGCNWTIQDGFSAGQTITHVHLHLIPRHRGDLPHPGDWYPRFLEAQNAAIDSASRSQLAPEELRQIVAHLRGTGRQT